MWKQVIPIILCSFIFGIQANATSWDEPWQDEVIRQADALILGKVDEANGKTVSVSLIKHLSGKQVPEKFTISGFYLLDICSSSGEGAELMFRPGTTHYFLLKEGEGSWQIATPTSGYATVEGSDVYATYRHSFHQALVPASVYEQSMKAIFNHDHGQEYNSSFAEGFINDYLNLKPAGFSSEEEAKLFYLQHTALEMIYHLGISTIEPEVLRPFLESEHVHARISAARALGVNANKSAAAEMLLQVLDEGDDDDLVMLMAIQALQRLKPAELKDDLKIMAVSAPTEAVAFECNLMDPRVCTSLPSIKEAMISLVQSLD